MSSTQDAGGLERRVSPIERLLIRSPYAIVTVVVRIRGTWGRPTSTPKHALPGIRAAAGRYVFRYGRVPHDHINPVESRERAEEIEMHLTNYLRRLGVRGVVELEWVKGTDRFVPCATTGRVPYF